VDELHAAIAAYLRGQRRPAEVRRPVREPERPLTDADRARQLFGYAEGRFPAPRCQVCGRAVDDDGGLFNLADMQRRRQCVECYCPF